MRMSAAGPPRHWLALLCGFLLLPVPGWSVAPLARVGAAEIWDADVESLRAQLPPAMRGQDDAWLLEILINRQLLVQEARRRGLDSSRVVGEGLALAMPVKLRDTLFERAVAAPVVVSEAELQQAYYEWGYDQRLQARVALISVASRQEAEALRQRLAAGEAFVDLAREHSLGESSHRGGELGVWRQGEIVGPLADQAWRQEVGQVSSPLEVDGRFHLLKVIERGPIGLEVQRDLVDNRLRSAKIRERRAAFMDSLMAAYGASFDPLGVKAVLARGQTALARIPEAKPGDDDTILARYRGGIVTLADYRSWLVAETADRWRPYPADAEQIEDYLRSRTILKRLYPAEARARGLDIDPEVTAWARRKREDLMIDALREVAIESEILSAAQMNRYYQEHRRELDEPARVFVEAALAPDEEGARRILAACERGASLPAAAAAGSDPPVYRVFHYIASADDGAQTPEPPVVDAARALGTAWTGRELVPLEGDGVTGYAVLGLVERRAGRHRSLADPEVRKRVRQALRQASSEELEAAFDAFVATLRRRHEGEIHYPTASPAH